MVGAAVGQPTRKTESPFAPGVPRLLQPGAQGEVCEVTMGRKKQYRCAECGLVLCDCAQCDHERSIGAPSICTDCTEKSDVAAMEKDLLPAGESEE